MGFLDKLKQQATDVASTVAEKTQETAKVGQLQMQLRSLKGEEKDALTEFGRQAYGLSSRRTRWPSARASWRGAAAKIADLRRRSRPRSRRSPTPRATRRRRRHVESSAEEVAEPAAAAAAAADRPPARRRLRRRRPAE